MKSLGKKVIWTGLAFAAALGVNRFAWAIEPDPLAGNGKGSPLGRPHTTRVTSRIT